MGFQTAAPDRYGLLRAFARENRKNTTFAEKILWEELRKNDFGVRFLRQHVIGDYIVDFVALSINLIIEVDGGISFRRTTRKQRYTKDRGTSQDGIRCNPFYK